MNKILYLLLIIVILFSYKILEKYFERFFPRIIKSQLWDSKGYYSWGLVLLIVYLIIRPKDYLFKLPINNKEGLIVVFCFALFTLFLCIQNPNSYYPRKSNKLRCVHFGVVQPIFEEVAFRGLILPMTIFLIGDNFNMIMLTNGIMFMLFHINYWSFEKRHFNLFFNFFFMGLFFTYVALITQSIFYSTICHIIGNGGYTVYRNWRDKGTA
ncbi:CPBP family intramembrane glutamic endopeptidase [Oceanirhabdus sp. W0125-5]|uniref:CPBP family intramembrane glutamic endopeptidase n=1 Tax=Oceanirhabdus sp. W0125-5 TaxID=2999116 RepID=UPI0022F34297|nr:CPBP family intramembrane glutamic endopeptidase [Oceanirhabdus sp. W0125-5]WBW98236.1 CPBP family intramembrane metalloprotease [Oceanirhabdus sp. W0125-5]